MPSPITTKRRDATSPPRRVRFDERAKIAYIPSSPRTPSPSLSEASLPSSSGPITPPSPFVSVPLPYVGGPCQIHPLLGVDPRGRQSLTWDVTISATSATVYSRQSPSSPKTASSDILRQSATNPALPTLTVVHESLPWAITVEASNSSIGVSCADILTEIRRALRHPVSEAEYHAALASPDTRKKVALAFHDRCGRQPSQRECEAERLRGLTRADFLLGRTRFMGLTPTKKGPDMWRLSTTT